MAVSISLQGVRNVTRALSIAKHNQYHDIIGTLLRHIALEANKESLDNKSCELLICLSVGAFYLLVSKNILLLYVSITL